MRGAAFLPLLLAACSPAAERDSLPRAAIAENWPHLPGDIVFGQVTGVDVDARNRVYVLQRGDRAWTEPFPTEPIGEDTVLVFDGTTGKLLDRWGAGLFVMPHGLSIDPQGKVWITDAGREQVMRFSADGRLELTIGTRGVTGEGGAHFGRPTDVAFDGERVLVSDGYLNGRIAIFDRKGRFLGEFGEKGSGAGQFAVPHSIALGHSGLVVADRENARLEAFGPDGTYISEVPTPEGGRPYAAKPFAGGLVSLEGRDARDGGEAVLRFWSGDGRLVRSLDASARSGPTRGHDLAVGPDGMIYIADVEAGRVLKIDPNGQGHRNGNESR